MLRFFRFSQRDPLVVTVLPNRDPRDPLVIKQEEWRKELAARRERRRMLKELGDISYLLKQQAG